MKKFILGKKIEMTQSFKDDGTVVPVTVISAGPCVVTQVRTTDTDGYTAVQLGFGKLKKTSKPKAGHLKELGPFRTLREFRVDDAAGVERGQTLDVSTFTPGDIVTVTGISKGRGFAGVVKRHHFSGSPATHGHKDQLRMPGSIGSTGPQRVFKGVRMAGQMGNERVTVRNLQVVSVDTEKNEIRLLGAVPGARHGLLYIQTERER